jgi:hypothetical protein
VILVESVERVFSKEAVEEVSPYRSHVSLLSQTRHTVMEAHLPGPKGHHFDQQYSGGRGLGRIQRWDDRRKLERKGEYAQSMGEKTKV